MFVKFIFIKRQLNSSKNKVPFLMKINQIYFSKILIVKSQLGIPNSLLFLHNWPYLSLSIWSHRKVKQKTSYYQKP